MKYFRCSGCGVTWAYDPATETPACPDRCPPKPKPVVDPCKPVVDPFKRTPKPKPKPEPIPDFGQPSVQGYTLADLLPEPGMRDEGGDLTAKGARRMQSLIARGWTLQVSRHYIPPAANGN